MSKQAYVCPVCGFWMDEPAADWNICSCCGCEFENHDRNATVEQIRAAWVANGMKWWSIYMSPPDGWDPVAQLAVLELVYG